MSFLDASYPNLGLIEYKFLTSLSDSCDEFKERLEEAKLKNKWVTPKFDVEVFSQVWGSTCTAFDIDDAGNPVLSGSAMTKEYTTIIHETVTDVYGVFIGNRGCYTVVNPTDAFLDDVKNHCIAGKARAKELY